MVVASFTFIQHLYIHLYGIQKFVKEFWPQESLNFQTFYSNIKKDDDSV